MDIKYKIAISVIVMASAFAIGRYSAPEKVKEVIKTVEVEKKTVDTDTDRQRHKDTIVVEETKPDGSKIVTTKIVEDSNTDRKTQTTQIDAKQSEQVKEITKSTTHVTVDVLVGINAFSSLSTPVYGAHVGANVIGPIRVGMFGLSNGVLGGTIGLQF